MGGAVSAARTKAVKPAPAVTAPEPEVTATAPAPAASTADQADPAPATPPVQEQATSAGSNPAPAGDQAADPAQPADGEAPSPAPAAGDPVPPVQDEAKDATAPAGEPLVIGVDYSSAADRTAFVVDGVEAGRSLTDGSIAVQAVSNRAPYTRGGIRFASRREPVILPTSTDQDQLRRLVADPAITLSLVHVASGRTVELPRDLFGPDGEPDFARLIILSDELARQIVTTMVQA